MQPVSYTHLHLEMSNDLVDAVKTDWNAKGIFKRIEKEEDKQIVVDSYCTRPYRCV